MDFNPKIEGGITPQNSNTKANADISCSSFSPKSRAHELLSLFDGIGQINFEKTNELALECVEEVLEHWLPDGELTGHEYKAINPTRPDNRLGSFSINVIKGVWSDFSCGDTGGDLISLVAYLEAGIRPLAAAKKILEFIAGLPAEFEAKRLGYVKKEQDVPDFIPIMPVPNEAKPRIKFFGAKLGNPTSTWDYKNATGELLFSVHRFDPAPGKTYLPETYCQDANGHKQWRLQAPPVPRPAYGLDRLAARTDVPVVFTEGEKAADAAQRLFPSFVAVTTMNGAKSPEKTDFSQFAGRKVYIAPDNDEAGFAYKDRLVTLLRGVGAEVIGVMNLNLLAKDGSPLAKAYDLADAEADGWTAEALAALGDDLWSSVDSVMVLPDAEIEEMPHGYSMKKDGVYYTKQGKEGAEQYWICSPLTIPALTRSEAGSEWGKLLVFDDADGNNHSWALPAEMLAGTGQQYREVLMSFGASISTNPYERSLFGSYLQMSSPTARALSVTQPGWQGKNFVLGSRSYGPAAEQVVLQTRSPASYSIYAQGGSFEEWKQAVAVPAIGNSRLALALCASLAGPILHLTKEESGGFHFRGRSSIGKSIGMSIGASVWGGRSYVVQWNSTDNGLEAIACRYNDMMLALDEIGEMDPAKAGKVAYMLANGQGKVRADTNADARMTKKWRLMILSSGEVSLADHMASAGQTIKAGQEIRLVDIPADPGKGLGVFENIHGASSSADFANALRENAFTHFGHAGAALVSALTDPEKQTSILQRLSAIMANFKQTSIPAGSDGQVVRVGHRFALVAAVGEICIELGILPWPAGEAISSINACYKAWIETRGGTGNLEADQIVAQVRRFLELNGESRFTEIFRSGIGDEGKDDHIRTIGRVGFRRSTENGGTEYFVLPEAFRSDICQGHDARYVVKVLSERGFLKLSGDSKPQVAKRLPGLDVVRVYHILPSIFSEEMRPAA